MTRILCQLAIDVDEKMTFPKMGFAKVDGVRGAFFEGTGIHGRSMDPFKNSALVARFSDPVYQGFDGELTINGWLTTNDVPEGETLCSLTTGLCNRSKIKKGETTLPDNAVWNLFDYITPATVGLTYLERYQMLVNRVATSVVPNVNVLPWRWINHEAEARAFEAEMLDLGYEGAIFRDPYALHKSGRATAKLQDFWRFKPTSDKDAYVIGFEEAQENQNEAKTNSLGRTERSSSKEGKVGNGMVGVLICRDFESGELIRVGPGAMKHDFRIAAFQHPPLITGHPIKYTSLDVGTKNAPRQARFAVLRSLSDLLPEQLALVDQWSREAA